MGVEIRVEGLTKSFGSQTIFEDVTLTIPAGEISVMLGPSGTGKSVFLKHLIGLLKPTKGHVYVDGHDVPNLPEKELYEVRKLFGVLFQDGALFGSMNLYDNCAFPLREHTKKSEKDIKEIVMDKLQMVGLSDATEKLPGEISGGMRKRAGLARALVLDPEIVLFDEPDSGLDPVRVAYLNQLIVDLNAQTGATFLIVTHDIGTARTVPDNIGLLFKKGLVMFGPRDLLLSSEEPVVKQFLNGRMEGPIGMSEEKDSNKGDDAEGMDEDSSAPKGTQSGGGDGVPPKLRTSEEKRREREERGGSGQQDGEPEDQQDHDQRGHDHEGQQGQGEQDEDQVVEKLREDDDFVDPDTGAADPAERTAILFERETTAKDSQPLEPKKPSDRSTGEELERPAQSGEGQERAEESSKANAEASEQTDDEGSTDGLAPGQRDEDLDKLKEMRENDGDGQDSDGSRSDGDGDGQDSGGSRSDGDGDGQRDEGRSDSGDGQNAGDAEDGRGGDVYPQEPAGQNGNGRGAHRRGGLRRTAASFLGRGRRQGGSSDGGEEMDAAAHRDAARSGDA